MWASNSSRDCGDPTEMCRLSDLEISRSVVCPLCWLAPMPLAMQNRPVAISASINASPERLTKYTAGVAPGTRRARSATMNGASPLVTLVMLRTWDHTP